MEQSSRQITAEQMARFSLIQGFSSRFSAGQMHITEDAHVHGALPWIDETKKE